MAPFASRRVAIQPVSLKQAILTIPFVNAGAAHIRSGERHRAITVPADLRVSARAGSAGPGTTTAPPSSKPHCAAKDSGQKPCCRCRVPPPINHGNNAVESPANEVSGIVDSRLPSSGNPHSLTIRLPLSTRCAWLRAILRNPSVRVSKVSTATCAPKCSRCSGGARSIGVASRISSSGMIPSAAYLRNAQTKRTENSSAAACIAIFA